MTGCADEAFPTVEDAQAELLARRTRAALSGAPVTVERVAYPCQACGLAHIVRADDAPQPIHLAS